MKKTNWYVVTGAPCSGKSTIIKELEARGYRVVHEVARSYVDAEIGSGKKVQQIKADLMKFERHILDAKIRIEAGLDPDRVVFMDRAVPDSIAYFEMAGFDPQMPAVKSTRFRYKAVFLFDRLEFMVDAVRSEDEETAMILDRLLEKAYRCLGYDITRVPVMPVEQRVEHILSYLE